MIPRYMRYVKVLWTRRCAGCRTIVPAGSYAQEDPETPGIVFHGDVCRALYWAWIAVMGETKLPPARERRTANRNQERQN